MTLRHARAPRPGDRDARSGILVLGAGDPKVLVSGFLGWVITRSYHVYALPLLRRRIRVVTDWTLALLFRRDVVAYGEVEPAPPLDGRGRPRGPTG